MTSGVELYAKQQQQKRTLEMTLVQSVKQKARIFVKGLQKELEVLFDWFLPSQSNGHHGVALFKTIVNCTFWCKIK